MTLTTIEKQDRIARIRPLPRIEKLKACVELADDLGREQAQWTCTFHLIKEIFRQEKYEQIPEIKAKFNLSKEDVEKIRTGSYSSKEFCDFKLAEQEDAESYLVFLQLDAFHKLSVVMKYDQIYFSNVEEQRTQEAREYLRKHNLLQNFIENIKDNGMTFLTRKQIEKLMQMVCEDLILQKCRCLESFENLYHHNKQFSDIMDQTSANRIIAFNEHGKDSFLDFLPAVEMENILEPLIKILKESNALKEDV